MPELPLSIRPFVEEDIPFALSQTEREGWDSTPRLIESVLRHDPDGCFLAEFSGGPVGMVTTTRYAKSAWAGNLIVAPASRRTGAGSALMTRAVGRLDAAGVETLRLEADPLGVGIYRRLGFVDEYESPRFRLERAPRVERPDCLCLLRDDLEEVEAFDLPSFGDRRPRLLRLLFETALAAYRVPELGPLEGYIFVQPSRLGVRLGPWIAKSSGAAEVFLRAALSAVPGKGVVVALPGPNAEGVRLLREAGFDSTAPSLRMVRGPAEACGVSEEVYGLASGAIG